MNQYSATPGYSFHL